MKFLKKISVLVLVLLLCFCGILSVSARDTFSDKEYTVSNKTYASQRPDVKVDTHTYYVGEIIGANDSAEKGTRENPFLSLNDAMASVGEYFKEGSYLKNGVLDEVLLVIVGDTHEARQLQGNYNIECGILTIISEEGENTIYIGSESATCSDNFFFVSHIDNTGFNGYVELNLGSPDMKGKLNFDLIGYNPNNDGSAFIHLGYRSNDRVAVCNIYNNVTIKNARYNEKTEEVLSANKGGIFYVDMGTINMYGGVIKNNNCEYIVKAENNSNVGAGMIIYNGVISNNIARTLQTKNNGKIVVYDGLFENNYYRGSWGSIEIVGGSNIVALYGGEFKNNWSGNNNDNDQMFAYAAGRLYISDQAHVICEAFTDLNGGKHPAEYTQLHPNGKNLYEIKSNVFYAKDGSAVGYGYCANKNVWVKDTTDTGSAESFVIDGYLYTQKGTTDCKYLVSGTEVDNSVLASENAVSSVYYYGDVPSHTKGELTSIVYNDGFDKVGEKHYNCPVCASNFVGDTADIIFTAKGYSVAEENKDEIMGGYTVDLDALDLYEKTNHTKLSYGIIFVNVSDVSSISFEGGKITSEKAIQAENLDRMFSQFNFKIGGFNKDAEKYDKLKALPLVIAMYVLENDNVAFIQKETSLAYVGDGVSVNGSDKKLGVLTLEQILKNVSEDNKTLEIND